MRKTKVYILLGVLISVSLVCFLGGNKVNAMTNFARKEGVPCSTCHTTIPRLNEVGYQYRAAGFRFPSNIGKAEEKKVDIGDYIAGRIQARYDASRSTTGPTSTNLNSLTFAEVTLYPATGSWGKNFSSLMELSILPEEPVEVENAYIRANFGEANKFFEARVGIFHPFEGFGASDRPVAISRPLFQTNATNFNQTTFFKPWGFDEAGAEIGYDYKQTSVRATIFNGLVLKNEDGTLTAFPAQGGILRKNIISPAHNTPDFQLFANQIIHPDGGNLSLYYYHGNLSLPIAGTNNFFRNNFDRLAFYAAYPVIKQLHLLGGYQYGRDHTLTGSTFNSRGVFLEADVPFHKYGTGGFRYDWFDPATNKTQNKIWAATAFVNVPIQNGLQFIAEYQHKNTERGLLPDKVDNAFQIRFIFIK